MKIAIVHDWLVTYAGAERVLEQLLNCFPEADLFSLIDFLPKSKRGFIQNKSVSTSFIQNLPFAETHYRNYLPLMPLAIEQFDLSGYDLVISSSHAVAKGIITGPDQYHICMCYSPIRYAWDMQSQYLKEHRLDRGLKGWATKWILHKIRIWDARTANGVDQFIAISQFIRGRVQKAYRRDAVVIYPPVDVDFFDLETEKQNFYVTASRLVPYKKIDLIVKTFTQMPDRKLVVIGDGPELESLKRMATENISILGYQSAKELKKYIQKARAFIFAAEEDFGIVCLEAQACGTPVIAYGKGGALETVNRLGGPTPTGVFFDDQSERSLHCAVKDFERNEKLFTPENCRNNALRFSVERFQSEFSNLVRNSYQNWKYDRN